MLLFAFHFAADTQEFSHCGRKNMTISILFRFYSFSSTLFLVYREREKILGESEQDGACGGAHFLLQPATSLVLCYNEWILECGGSGPAFGVQAPMIRLFHQTALNNLGKYAEHCL
ncbi:hypothetical protein ILYODFUR_038177 [Ilyodon furcidens]|uniref:Uncharacterized protein n=1 Tax=Ilyodon furcidens TaxID=33524 RepID=A0ABV0TUH1_9TELE